MESNYNVESNITISLYYKIEYVNIISSLICEYGKAHGANDSEQIQLTLIGEEVFAFIMQGIPKYEFDEQFTLKCTTNDNGLLMEFSSHGEPISNRDLKGFSPFEVNANEENIGLDIINAISDSCDYINRGSDGWCIVVSKHINALKIIQQQDDINDDLLNQAAKEKLIVRLATEEDAKGIISLVYKTYRYSYAKKMFYNEELLQEALRTYKVVSVIALNNKGEIVGHNGLLFESDKLYESGMFMTDPLYRRNLTAFLLLKKCMSIVKEEKWHNIILYNKCITSHTLSQKTSAIVKFHPTALKPSVYPRPSFIGFGEKVKRRESLIINVQENENLVNNNTIYTPAEHLDICRDIINNLNISIPISSEVTVREKTKNVKTSSDSKTGSLTIKIDEPGDDLLKLLNNLKRTAIQNDIVTINCEISNTLPLPNNLNDTMFSAGYFFCGIDVCPNSQWRLVYTNLLYQNFDFESISLYDAFAIRLKEYAKNIYDKIEQ